jgi:hypothetical protein
MNVFIRVAFLPLKDGAIASEEAGAQVLPAEDETLTGSVCVDVPSMVGTARSFPGRETRDRASARGAWLGNKIAGSLFSQT